MANVDPSAWPLARWMYAVRDGDVLVPAGGEAPVYEGLRAGVSMSELADAIRRAA